MIANHGALAILLIAINANASLLRTASLSTQLEDFGACLSVSVYNTADCSGDSIGSESFPMTVKGEHCSSLLGKSTETYCDVDVLKVMWYDNDTCEGDGKELESYPYGCTEEAGYYFSFDCALEPCAEGSDQGNELIEAFRNKHMVGDGDLKMIV